MLRDVVQWGQKVKYAKEEEFHYKHIEILKAAAIDRA